MESEWIDIHYLNGKIILTGQLGQTTIEYTLESAKERDEFYDLMDKHRDEIKDFARKSVYREM